ncbi:MAG: hypothetical protein JWO05_2308 [Gemmatimonadetes bacterium]|nr:hypothetical protein [Gemmatimonadota bacterium]
MLALVAAPQLSAQRGPAPDANTPRILIATFRSASEPALGVQAADALRSRVTTEVPVKQLWALSKNDINNTLTASGYKADSALSAVDLKELAKLVRADEIVEGIVTRTPAGVKVEARLMLSRDITLAQPLPAVEAKNPGDAAKLLEKSLGEARKQLADNKACENFIRDKAYDKAIAAAKAGIVKYSQSTLARLCWASALQESGANPDSVLKVTQEVLAIDPRSTLALRVGYAALQAKNDQEGQVQALLKLYTLDPGNQSLLQSVIAELAKLGQPEKALPIIDTVLIQNPGDPQLLRQKYALLYRAQQWKNVLATGAELEKADTSAADNNFFSRLADAAQKDSQPQLAAQIASRAVAKFPKSADLYLLQAGALEKSGQLQQAADALNRGLAIDPKLEHGYLLLARIQGSMNQTDAATATARKAVAAGEDPKIWGAMLLSPTQVLYKAASESKKPEDYQKVLSLAQLSDSLSQSPTAKFFKGIAAFQIGYDAVQNAQKSKSCALSKTAQDMFVIVQTDMPAGGQIDKATAAQLLTYTGQLAPSADKMAKAYCK